MGCVREFNGEEGWLVVKLMDVSNANGLLSERGGGRADGYGGRGDAATLGHDGESGFEDLGEDAGEDVGEDVDDASDPFADPPGGALDPPASRGGRGNAAVSDLWGDGVFDCFRKKEPAGSSGAAGSGDETNGGSGGCWSGAWPNDDDHLDGGLAEGADGWADPPAKRTRFG